MSTVDFSGNSYLDPNVYVDEISTPSVAPLGIAPTVVGLVGDTQRYSSNVEFVQLTATTGVQLGKLGISSASVVVTDRYSGTTYALTTDYTLTTGTGADGVLGTLDDTLTIARSVGSSIPSGGYVTVSYNYTDANYYAVQSFADFDDVRAAYGSPFTPTGAINSPMTLAAFLAFLNGAQQVVCAPIQAAAPTPTTAEWSTTISELGNYTTVNLIVPISGDTAVHQLVQSYVNTQFGLGNYVRGFVGQLASTGTPAALQTQATGYADTRMTVIGPSAFNFYRGAGYNLLQLDGQYAAAAVAGRMAGQPVQTPITKKSITGFVTIPSQPNMATIVQSQRSGVCWLRQRRDGSIVVQHGLTTNMSTIYTREISVQAAKDRLMQFLTETMESPSLIGQVITNQTPQFVVGAVIGSLETCVATGLITGYSAVKWRQPTSNPTLIEIQFMYKPALPLNYIHVQFSIDTNTGSTSFTSVTGNANTVTAAAG